jgi:hypothetical protein
MLRLLASLRHLQSALAVDFDSIKSVERGSHEWRDTTSFPRHHLGATTGMPEGKEIRLLPDVAAVESAMGEAFICPG